MEEGGLGSKLKGLGFGFRVDLGSLWFRASGSGFRVRIRGSEFQGSVGLRVKSFGLIVAGLGLRI